MEDVEGQVNVIKGMTVHVREILKIVIPWNATFRLLLTKLESPDMDQESQEAETIARDMHQQLTLFYERYVSADSRLLGLIVHLPLSTVMYWEVLRAKKIPR